MKRHRRAKLTCNFVGKFPLAFLIIAVIQTEYEYTPEQLVLKLQKGKEEGCWRLLQGWVNLLSWVELNWVELSNDNGSTADDRRWWVWFVAVVRTSLSQAWARCIGPTTSTKLSLLKCLEFSLEISTVLLYRKSRIQFRWYYIYYVRILRMSYTYVIIIRLCIFI